MIRYKTIREETCAEEEVSRSRFIAHLSPADSRAEAEEYIKTIGKQYRDATHNVPAMVLGEQSQVQWASDDGEPQGTSGAPILNLLLQEGITNVVCVVTRYFGGTKLGTGGLVRAYTGCVRKALEQAEIHIVREYYELRTRIDYSILGKLQSLAAEQGFQISDIVYEEAVTATLTAEKEQAEALQSLVLDLSGGKREIISEGFKNA